jgi:hypothetical protein
VPVIIPHIPGFNGALVRAEHRTSSSNAWADWQNNPNAATHKTTEPSPPRSHPPEVFAAN